MSKKQPVINCTTCFFSITHPSSDKMIRCRVEPRHYNLPGEHWCGKYLFESVGEDLIQRPKGK